MAIRVDLIDGPNALQPTDDYYIQLIHFGIKPSAYAFSRRPQLAKIRDCL